MPLDAGPVDFRIDNFENIVFFKTSPNFRAYFHLRINIRSFHDQKNAAFGNLKGGRRGFFFFLFFFTRFVGSYFSFFFVLPLLLLFELLQTLFLSSAHPFLSSAHPFLYPAPPFGLDLLFFLYF